MHGGDRRLRERWHLHYNICLRLPLAVWKVLIPVGFDIVQNSDIHTEGPPQDLRKHGTASRMEAPGGHILWEDHTHTYTHSVQRHQALGTDNRLAI